MNKTPRMQYGIAEVTQEMRHEIQQLLLLGYQGKEIQEAYKVTLSVITQERKRLQLGKWSPNSPSEKARKRRVYQIPTATPTATRRPSNPSSGVVEIPIDEIRPRETPPAHTVWDRVRELQPNKAIKFPCTWKHDGNYCGAIGNIRKIARAKNWRFTWECRNKEVYVGRYE